MKQLNPKALTRIGKSAEDFMPMDRTPMEQIAALQESNQELREALEALLGGVTDE